MVLEYLHLGHLGNVWGFHVGMHIPAPLDHGSHLGPIISTKNSHDDPQETEIRGRYAKAFFFQSLPGRWDHGNVVYTMKHWIWI